MRSLFFLFFFFASWTIEPEENIALFRGSFDPPHKGHLEIIEKTLQSGISQIFIYPIEGEKNFTQLERIEMLKAFETEQIHVIASFDNKLLNSHLYLIYGADVVSSYYNSIKSNPLGCEGYFFISRAGSPLSFDLISSFDQMHIVPIEANLPYSSSEVRKRLRENEPISDLVHPTTENLIQLSKAYEKICLAKQKGIYPQSVCKAYSLRGSIPNTIQELTGACQIKFIKERDKTCLFKTEKHIIKVYPEKDYGEFIDEIWAIETLKRHEPKNFTVPSIVAIYSLFSMPCNYYLIVEKIAPGLTLCESKSSSAFYRYGMALAELHQLKSIKTSKLSSQFFNTYSYLPYSIKKKMKFAKKIGYIQYDVHEANALYDELSDRICLLDLSHIGFFTNKKLDPTAPVVLDYAYFLNYLDNLPNATEAFKAGYKEGGGELFSEEVLSNYRDFIHYHKNALEKRT